MTRRQIARIRFIRQRRAYTVRELALLLGVHTRTVHQWHTDGLVAIEDSHPLLFLGRAAKDFLKARLAMRRQKLQQDQFFCMRCRRPRLSLPEKSESRPTGKRIGRGKELILLYGECSECGCKMVRFASRQAPKWRFLD